MLSKIFSRSGLVQLRPAVHVEELRRRGRDKRGVGRRGDARHVVDKRHVLGTSTNLVVPNEEAVGASPEGSVLFLVDALEELALVKLDGFLQIVEELLLRGVEQAKLERPARLGVEHQVGQPPPGGLKLLKLIGVNDFVDLLGKQLVDLRDPLLNRAERIGADGHVLVEHLVDEFSDEALGVFFLLFAPGHAALFHNPVKSTFLFGSGCALCLGFGVFSHGTKMGWMNIL